jgi:hypothetical protein
MENRASFSPASLLLLVVAGLTAAGQRPGERPGYQDTPQLPGQNWKVHDSQRPYPRVVSPGTPGGGPPSDAVLLFEGADLSRWQSAVPEKRGPAPWKVEQGYFEVVPGTGDIETRDEFGDCQIHLEWRTPDPPKGESQDRGNSGIFFFGRYELQVLDSYENPTYADGQAAALYGQYPPLVNASRKPGEWQTYDAVFIAPRFENGRLAAAARITVLHNGVLVHHSRDFLGATEHRRVARYTPHGPKGRLRLQDHGNPIRYRNIWIRQLTGYDAP